MYVHVLIGPVPVLHAGEEEGPGDIVGAGWPSGGGTGRQQPHSLWTEDGENGQYIIHNILP